MSNTKDQNVTITLEEYMEFQELKKHGKHVKVTEVSKYLDRADQGISVEWLSDGAVWMKLTNKLSRAGARIEELVLENKRLKDNQTVGFWKRVLIKMAGNKDD